MPIQSFTSGQTLTAANMTTLQQNDYNWSTSAQTASYVLVAADAGKTVTMTNAGATTITVNTSLFTAGDTVRILNLGAGACTITAGTATVNSAGSLVLPQYGSGTLWFSSASAAIFIPDDRNAGLTLITAQTIGSTVSSVTVSNVFSATYDAYKIVISSGVGSSTNAQLLMTFGATSSNYKWGYVIPSSGSATGVVSTAGTSIPIGEINTNILQMNAEVMNPFLTKHTYVNGYLGFNDANGNGRAALTAILQDTTSYTAFTLTSSTGTLTGGTIRVYGYQNS